MFTIRGENVYPAAIDEVLTALDGYGGEHRIMVSRDETMDKLAVRVEYGAALDGDEAGVAAFRTRAQDALRTTLGVSTAVVPGAAEHVRAHGVQGAPGDRRARAVPRE